MPITNTSMTPTNGIEWAKFKTNSQPDLADVDGGVYWEYQPIPDEKGRERDARMVAFIWNDSGETKQYDHSLSLTMDQFIQRYTGKDSLWVVVDPDMPLVDEPTPLNKEQQAVVDKLDAAGSDYRNNDIA